MSAVVIASAVGALVLVGIAALAWRQVRFDGLGLWPVEGAGEDHGLWYAAFSNDVRFIAVDGSELTPGDLRPWVILHLGLPFAALLVLGTGWLAARRADGQPASP